MKRGCEVLDQVKSVLIPSPKYFDSQGPLCLHLGYIFCYSTYTPARCSGLRSLAIKLMSSVSTFRKSPSLLLEYHNPVCAGTDV